MKFEDPVDGESESITFFSLLNSVLTYYIYFV